MGGADRGEIVDDMRRRRRQPAAATHHDASLAPDRESRHVQHDQARSFLDLDRLGHGEGERIRMSQETEQEGVRVRLDDVVGRRQILGGEEGGESALGTRCAR